MIDSPKKVILLLFIVLPLATMGGAGLAWFLIGRFAE